MGCTPGALVGIPRGAPGALVGIPRGAPARIASGYTPHAGDSVAAAGELLEGSPAGRLVCMPEIQIRMNIICMIHVKC